MRIGRSYIVLTKKTCLYWWPKPRHRHYKYRPDGSSKPAFFSFKYRVSLGGGYRCSWIELWIFELRTVHRPGEAK